MRSIAYKSSQIIEHPFILVGSGASESVLNDATIFLSNEEITSVGAGFANGQVVSARRREIVTIRIGEKMIALSIVHCILEVRINFFSRSSRGAKNATKTVENVRYEPIDRYDTNICMDKAPGRNNGGLYVLDIILAKRKHPNVTHMRNRDEYAITHGKWTARNGRTIHWAVQQIKSSKRCSTTLNAGWMETQNLIKKDGI